MIASTEHKDYQALLKKGKGSILQALRADKGGGKGLIAGGIVLLGAGLLLSLFGLFFVFGVPGLILLVLGIVLKNKRDSSWISYYRETTGYSEGEIQQIDRELASPSVTLVVTPSASVNNCVSCFFTEHYLVMNGMEPYVRRLEDFIAVAFSDSTDRWYMASLTKQDKETRAVGLFTDTDKKPTLCKEVMEELCRRNPDVLCGQAIVCEGRNYILERDGAQILRLYQEGRKLELA
ncbi:MAG: hypothetical protein NC420_12160 [Eubacterium sp.]|nr:hypothetical protein [Eubacterium sp.]MCM1215804.1 hypothetical protein [Lachnospiraceae bacterium]MCM1238366.1 hypothetical protein [Lachnospiraceae bacterium]